MSSYYLERNSRNAVVAFSNPTLSQTARKD
jgi:hypothetical protein